MRSLVIVGLLAFVLVGCGKKSAAPDKAVGKGSSMSVGSAAGSSAVTPSEADLPAPADFEAQAQRGISAENLAAKATEMESALGR